jgi:hypothetical protein
MICLRAACSDEISHEEVATAENHINCCDGGGGGGKEERRRMQERM